MEIISVINRKGGVGKTATAHALGAGLMRKGYKVLFIDLDSQANLTFSIGADFNKVSIYEVLTGKATAQEAIQHAPGGDVITASYELSTADMTLTETGKEYKLKEALESIQSNYDYIVIDTPAQLGTLTINALTASTSAIIPVQAEIYSIQGIGQLLDTITSVKKYCNRDLFIKGILVTRYNARAIISRDMLNSLEDIAERLNTKVYKAQIRECVAIKEAQASKTDIFSYSSGSNAALDYESFVNEFLA